MATATLQAPVASPQKVDTRPLEKKLGVLTDAKLHALVKKRLRLAMTPRELTEHLEAEGGYEKISFYVYYTGNQEMSLDYGHWDTVKTFTKGACAILASELNRVTGLPLVLFSHPSSKEFGWQGHAVVKLPNGDYFDVEGPKSRDNFSWSYADFSSWTEEEVSREEFNKRVGLDEGEEATDSLEPLEKAALAKVCFDLIRDYALDNPEKAGTEQL